MKFRGPNHKYKCAPKLFGNEESEDPFFITLLGVSMTERDEEHTAQMAIQLDNDATKARELVTQQAYDKMKRHVVSFENLFVDDKEITDFDTFYSTSPAELVHWVNIAINSTDMLTDAEVKNS